MLRFSFMDFKVYNFRANAIFVPTANIGLDEQDLVLLRTYLDVIYSILRKP